jgi:hypothetical protein
MTNNGNQSNIERVVMRRVHRIHTLRPMISFSALFMLIALAALYGIGREVWVAHVFENMPRSNNPVLVSRFWLDAFTHTRLVVQALALVTLAAIVYLARETARTLTFALTPARA